MLKKISLLLLAMGFLGGFFFYLRNTTPISLEDKLGVYDEKETDILEKISLLSAGQDISYFEEELGVAKYRGDVSEIYTEYVFEKGAVFFQVLVNEEIPEVSYWAVTSCDFEPLLIKKEILSKYTLEGRNIVLNSSTFDEVFLNKSSTFEHFVGNTASTYAYESLYLGNPGNYMTVIVGVNDVCGFEGADLLLNGMIDEYRVNTKINTYAETSSFVGAEILELLNNQNTDDVSITFGVDRIRINTL